jgi:DNA-binding PadR family transcriptional regulator
MPRQRLSRAAVAVLHALAHGHRHGFDIIATSGLTSASVYPTLGKLEELGLVTSTWESVVAARAEKRPPRRNYELRPAGRRALAEELERDRALQRVPRSIAGARSGKP